MLTGTRRGDILEGLGGADRLYGLGGADRLYAAAGNDRLSGGAGADKLSVNLPTGQPLIVRKDDPHWQSWIREGATELMVIADLPGQFPAGNPGHAPGQSNEPTRGLRRRRH